MIINGLTLAGDCEFDDEAIHDDPQVTKNFQSFGSKRDLLIEVAERLGLVGEAAMVRAFGRREETLRWAAETLMGDHLPAGDIVQEIFSRATAWACEIAPVLIARGIVGARLVEEWEQAGGLIEFQRRMA